MDEERVREIVAEETSPLSAIGCATVVTFFLVVICMVGCIVIGIDINAALKRRIQQLEQKVKP